MDHNNFTHEERQMISQYADKVEKASKDLLKIGLQFKILAGDVVAIFIINGKAITKINTCACIDFLDGMYTTVTQQILSAS